MAQSYDIIIIGIGAGGGTLVRHLAPSGKSVLLLERGGWMTRGPENWPPYCTRAEQMYQVHGKRGEDPTEPPASAPYPYPPVALAGGNTAVLKPWRRLRGGVLGRGGAPSAQRARRDVPRRADRAGRTIPAVVQAHHRTRDRRQVDAVASTTRGTDYG